MIKIEYIGEEPFNVPRKAYDYDAGYDLYLEKSYIILPNSTVVIPFKVKLHLNKNECGIICMRSSFAILGLIANTAPLDYGYKGEPHLIVHNISNNPITLNIGTSVCQIVIFKIPKSKGVFGKRNYNKFGSSERRLK